MVNDKKNILVVVIIILAAAGVYLNSLTGDFVWDAEKEIKNNEFIRDLGNWPQAFTTELSKMYRPVELITYMLDYKLYNLNPAGYHVTNILLHVICSLLVYSLILALIKERPPALIAALIFTAHPIHTESVAWIAARDDALMAIFYLAAMIMVHKYLNSERFPGQRKMALIGGISLSCILSLLSKEMAVSLPLLALVFGFIASPGKKKPLIKIVLLLVAVIIFYTAIRFFVLKSFGQIKSDDKYHYLITILTAPKIFTGYYLSVLIFPIRLCADYGFPTTSFMEIVFYHLTVILLVAIAVKYKKNQPLVCIGITWIMITILPAMNFIPKSQLISERYLYLPSVGYVMIIAGIIHALNQNIRFKNWLYPGALIILIFYALLTINRNTHWQNAQILWAETLKNPLASTRPYYNLALIHKTAGRHEQAITLYQAVIDREEKKIEETMTSQARLRAIFKAEVYARTIASRKRIIAETLAEQSQSYLAKHDVPQAIAALKKATVIFPNTALPYLYLAGIYYQQGRVDEALELYFKANDLTWESAWLFYKIALCFLEKQDRPAAKEYLLKALRLDPQYKEAAEKLKTIEDF